MMIKPLSAFQLRAFARKHARPLAELFDDAWRGEGLAYDDGIAAVARLLVNDGPLFCEIVSIGTGLDDEHIQSTPWPEVVKLGCEVIEAAREAWRPAWPNGFLQAILGDELRPFSKLLRGVA